MAPDVFTEVSSKNWFSRIGNSIMGSIFGLILFLVAIPLLFWNEGRAVKTYRSLKEGAAAVITVQADSVNAANEGRLVHMTGDAATADGVEDESFGVSQEALKLNRKVEMYQWVEHKDSKSQKKLGGGEETVTTYRYEKEWKDDKVDSGSFRHPEDHGNPSDWAWTSEEFVAPTITVGAFTLSDNLIGQINNYEDLPVTTDTLPDDVKATAKSSGGGYYIGADPGTPKIGDLRIHYSLVKPGPVSVVAQQNGSDLGAYQTKAGGTVELLDVGTRTSAAMFQAAQAENAMITWVLRLVGFILMFIGLALVMKPFSVLADVIPILGNVVEFGTGLASFLIALVSAVVVIAVSWIVVRPVVGISLLVATLAIVVFAMKSKKGKVA